MTVETKPFYQSPQTLAALATIAGGIVGFSHFCCLYFGWCVLEKVSEVGWTLALGSIAAIVGGIYALYVRLRRGKDPNDPAPKVTLLPKKEN